MFNIKQDKYSDRFGFALRLAIFYGAVFMIIGIFMPYYNVWLQWRGLSEDQIAIIAAMPLFVRSGFTPLISFIADRRGDPRSMITVMALGTLLSVCILFFCESFWPILLVTILFSAFWTAVMPLTETVAMTGVREAGLDYGRMRLWGSLSFIVASYIGGHVIKLYTASPVLWMLLAGAVLVLAASCLLPKPKGYGRLKAATTLPPIRLHEAMELLRSSVFWIFLIAASTVNAAHAVYYTFGTIHWQKMGIPEDTIGMLWAVGVIAEILLFAFAAPLLKRLGPVRFICIAALAAVVRWTIMSFNPSLPWTFVLQTLHGLTFGAAHLGSIYFIGQAVPERYSATAQGLYAAFAMGVVMGLIQLGTGRLYILLQEKAFLVMSLLGLISCVFSVLLLMIWKGKSLSLEK